MSLVDKIKGWFASDKQFLASEGRSVEIHIPASPVGFNVPEQLEVEAILKALVDYGKREGYCQSSETAVEIGAALMDSVRNQIIKMHEEILKFYQRNNQTPDDKMLNMLTVTNIFYLSMGSAILAKVKKSNLIAQGFFVKLLKKSGPDLFYREVMAMAGHKYGSEEVENLHRHIQRASYLLLVKADSADDTRLRVIEIARAMYLYALRVTLK